AGNQTFLSFVTVDPTNAQTLYAGSVSQDTTASHLWKTTNGGSTWGALDGNAGFPFGMPVEGLVIDPGNPNVVYVGTDIGVYQSTNGGSSWSRFGSGLPYANVKDLYIAPDGSFLRAATFGRGAWEILPSSTPPTGPTITQHPASVSKNAGEQATFSVAATGTGTLSYQWQKGGASIPGATSATYTTPPTIAADDGAQFRAVVTDSTGSNTSNPATLTVVPCTGGGGGTTQVLQNPGFESGVSPWVQSNTLIIDNDNAITAHGGSWYAFLGDYSSSTTDSLYQTVAIDANATAADLRFWMTIGNESGTPAGATNILTVKVRNSSGADLGTLATFNNTQANYPTYVQRGPWSLLAWKGQTVQVYLTSFQPGGTGTGTAFIVDDFTFNVTTPGGGGGTPPTIITSPANQTVTVGSTVTFTSSAGGTMPITMQWRKNGAVIQGANNPSFTIASAQVSDSGTYDVQAFNCAGFATSNAATLTVNVASPVTVTVAPKPVALMVGGTQSFAATVTGTPNTAVTWVLSGLGGLSTTTGNPTVFTAPSTLATTPSTATLTATSVADPAKSDSVTITIRSRDLSGDTLTDVLDLATLARYFGQPASAFPAGDLDGSGTIDEGDLAILLAGI
ncbi:MAG: immunoglobulin domain-containing protein, partial [Acidobacteria bacterium]|nr:immunoglobulin domain-containing protein [Acidobacteriota bacterium]